MSEMKSCISSILKYLQSYSDEVHALYECSNASQKGFIFSEPAQDSLTKRWGNL